MHHISRGCYCMIYVMIWYMIWWHDMIWYDMIYDMIWYDDMIWYGLIYDMIYLLNVTGLTPSGSSTGHIYTQTIHRTSQWNKIPRMEHSQQ